jgi:GNAT superfamily N-acetyltransferase
VSIEVSALSHDNLDEARGLLETATPYDLAAQVAEEKLFGGAPAGAATALGVRQDGELVGIAVTSSHWLRLFVVGKGHLGHGVGSALLDAAEHEFRECGVDRIRTMDQPGNYLAPGIDARNAPTIDWFERRGFERTNSNHSLVVELASNPRVSRQRADELSAACVGLGYTVRRARRADRSALSEMITAEFSAEWAFEVNLALSSTPEGVHVAVSPDGELAAFAAHDGNNRGLGWFGPAGTVPAHRERGLGAALLLECLVEVAEAGHDQCLISWIGPRDFYERTVGIAGEREYVVMSKAV